MKKTKVPFTSDTSKPRKSSRRTTLELKEEMIKQRQAGQVPDKVDLSEEGKSSEWSKLRNLVKGS